MKAPWLAFGIVLALSLTACQKKAALTTQNDPEDPEKSTPIGRAIYSNAFGLRTGDPAALINNNMNGYSSNGYFAGGNSGATANPFENPVAYKLDSFMPNLTSVVSPQWPFIRRCGDPGRFEAERQMVLDVVTQSRAYPQYFNYAKLIPVRYAVAVGTATDDKAYQSHLRSILRKNYNGKSYLAIGPKVFPTGYSARYYEVNATGARNDFMNGFMCFFNIVPVNGNVVSGAVPGPEGVTLTDMHNWQYMHYGPLNYTDADNEAISSGLKSPRLFAAVGETNVIQTVPLYVADIRNDLTDPDNGNAAVNILRPENITQLPRMYELTEPGRKIFNLPNVWKYRDRMTQVFATNRPVGGFPYIAYEGMPQLIDWLAYSGVSGTVLAASYTPIVLDLGQKGIITSSVRHGTFFNTGMYRNYADSNPATMYDIHHQTAWLGGEIESTGLINSVNAHYRPTMKDGFLVLPDANGLVKDARNLIGQFTPVMSLGTTTTYSNGFQALAAMSNKVCGTANADPKSVFLGPWDPMYSTLKVWIDKDRNGHVYKNASAPNSDRKELYTLEEAGVAAINVCKLYDRQEYDQYGNDTSQRSAFLYMPGEQIVGNETEILNRINNGKTAAGAPAEFRVSVDIRFRAQPDTYLENIDTLNYGR